MPAAKSSETKATATTALGSVPAGNYGFYELNNAWFVSRGVGDTGEAHHRVIPCGFGENDTVGEALSAAVALALLRFTGATVSFARSVPRA